MNLHRLARIGLLLCALIWTPIQAEPSESPTAQSSRFQRSIGLAELSSPGALVVRNMLRHLYAEFGVRSDELVRSAELQLFYTPSPALDARLSHLKVYLNDELMGVLPIAAEQSGAEREHRVTLNTQFIRDFNHLRLELIGSNDSLPENPLHASLWVDFSARSQLHLEIQRLRVDNDLARLPEPFFDPRDNSPLELPFVFADRPGPLAQTAAALLASWFGVQSGWRQAAFPVSFAALPANRSAVVFATNRQRPAFLRHHPPVSAPTLSIIDHPDSPHAKLLLVLGPDDPALLSAARALALGEADLQGSSLPLRARPEPAARRPYDAPNWVSSTRPTLFQDLLDTPLQLQATGLIPSPVNLALNVPPDLFTWRSAGVPLTLNYRYTPPLQKAASLLSLGINDHFIQAFALDDAETGKSTVSDLLPLGLLEHRQGSRRVLIPARHIDPQNELQMNFTFNALPGCDNASQCSTSLPMNIQAAIDADSSLDFSAFHHYKAMPDLQAFASAGYPFTRLADLSQTRVLMPRQPDAAQLELLLSLMGSMGAHTGAPVSRLRISDDWQPLAQGGDDLLLIGPLAAPFIQALEPELGARIQQTQSAMAGPWQPGTSAELFGFQSPFADRRSAVLLLADSAAGYRLIARNLRAKDSQALIGGAMTRMREGHIESVEADRPYYVGSLPWWLWLWFHLADYPLLLLGLALASALLLAAWLFVRLSRLARHRLDVPGDPP